MRTKTLAMLLGGCLAVATWPVLPWLAARLFDAVDDGWLDFLGALVYTFPIALGLAAVVLAVHGMVLHRELADELETEFGSVRATFATAGVPAGSPVAATAVAGATVAAPATTMAAPAVAANGDEAGADEDAAPARGGKMAVRERPGFKGSDGKKKKSAKVRTIGRRAGNVGRVRLGSKIREQIRYRTGF